MAMRARNEREKKLAGTIYEAATGEDGKWRAAAWLLERMYPGRYSKKQIVERADPPKPIGWADEEVEEIDYEVVQQDPDAN